CRNTGTRRSCSGTRSARPGPPRRPMRASGCRGRWSGCSGESPCVEGAVARSASSEAEQLVRLRGPGGEAVRREALVDLGDGADEGVGVERGCAGAMGITVIDFVRAMPGAEIRISALIARAHLEFAAARGVALDDVLAAFGLSRADTEDDERELPVALLNALWVAMTAR